MSDLVNEMKSYIGSSSMTKEEFLEHYGMPRRSGRYPWGSGDNPYQHEGDFLSRIDNLKKAGWKETPENIKKTFGLTTTEYRIEKSLCSDERKALDIARAKSLREDGLNNSEIGRKMGVNESTVRGWFKQEQQARYKQARATADFLKEQVNKKKMIDIGDTAEISVAEALSGGSTPLSKEKLKTALYLLEREGYHVYGGRVPQVTNNNQMTTLKVLAAPDVEHKEIFNYDKIKTINEYITRDGGQTYEKKFHYPTSIDSKRVKILLKNEKGPDGLVGSDQDGLVQIRRGVPDLDLGNSRYSQVRILVDGNKYIKGMAVYSDNIPDGYDIIFNTNKTKYEDALKPIKNDPENPFGSSIKDINQGGQYWYTDKNGKKRLGAINKRADEGDWTDWKDSLPSQFLSKQSKTLIKKQLDLAKANKNSEYDEIMSLNNPTIKRYYLKDFADKCDAAAVDLKAAALPGQKYHVIIPINTLKNTEVYAPQYKPGTKLALIRYPHGGTFEIPILTVTDKNPQAKKIIGPTSIDAIGITKDVAERLSGADFDGDTVMCIPTHDRNGKVKITSTDQLKGLTNFDSKSYQYDHATKDKNGVMKYFDSHDREIKIMKNTDVQMGKISNLITDMTLQGATEDELARAVRHSMVVIDAEKHKLDWKKSEIDNNIAQLKKRYQPKYDKDGNYIRSGGASSIISAAKGQANVPKRKGQYNINIKGKPWYDPTRPEGAKVYKTADDKDLYYAVDKKDKKTGLRKMYLEDGGTIEYDPKDKKAYDKYTPVMKYDKNNKVYFESKDGKYRYKSKMRTTTSTRMGETDNAETLVSTFKNPKEYYYADYANHMKALANKARLSIIATGRLKSNPQAKKIYAKEVASLNEKLNDAKKNTIKERAAQRLAASYIKEQKEKYPDISSKDLKKMSQQAIERYRTKVGSISRRERSIKISDKEWEAIQAGAISDNKLGDILANSDPDTLRQRAMPKQTNTLSQAQIARIKALSASNFTLAQIAEKMNISTSSVSKYLKGAA